MDNNTTQDFNGTSKAAVLERTKRADVAHEPVLAGIQAGPGGSTLFVVHEKREVSVGQRLSETWDRLTGSPSNVGELKTYDQSAFTARYGDPGSIRTLEQYEDDAHFLRNRVGLGREISEKADTMLLRVREIYDDIASLPEPLSAPSTPFSAPGLK